MVDADLNEKLFRCWHRGDGIGETIRAVKCALGIDVDFETVRRAFVNCCDRFCGSAQEAV